MRLLMFNYEYPPLGGGGGVIHQQIAEELATRHEVTLVTSGYRDLPSREEVGGVVVHRVPVWGRTALATASLPSLLSYHPACLRVGGRLLDSFRPEVINSHFAVPTGPSAVRLAQRARVPHVLSIHGGDIFDPSKRLSPHRLAPLRRVVRWVLQQADRVVAPSRNTADNAVRWYDFTGDIRIIPHGMRYPEVTPVSRAAFGLREDAPVLVTVGRLVARKAHDQLIQLLPRLPDPRTQLVIVGEGPERGALEALARSLQVWDRVHLPGFISEERKHQLLQAANLFVSATLHEGFGLMYLEAMAHGLPVVTYDHGGQADFLTDGQTGRLVPLGALDQLATAVADLLANEAACRRMAGINRELAHHHSVEGCAQAYERLFEELVEQATAQRAAAT